MKLGEDWIPQMIVVNVLRSIVKNTIMYENSFPIKKRTLLLDEKVKYVQSIIVSRDIENLGWGGKRRYSLYWTLYRGFITINHRITAIN